MNDRYLYKAKRKHDSKFFKKGEWVEGAYYYIEPYTDKCFIIQWNSTGLGFNEFIEVDEESVSQCTGLKGKNGNLVWENDVVRIKYDDDFSEVGWIKYSNCGVRYNFVFGTEKYSIDDSCDIEVIGNIFDNPELINE